MKRDSDDVASTNLSRITIPRIIPPTPEEIERRRALVAKVRALREEMGAVGVSTADLIREAREGEGDNFLTLAGDQATPDDFIEGESTPTSPRIELPPIPPPTPEELERRRVLVDQILARRDRIGPIGISVTDLIREVRDEADGIDE
ncbi:MAG TPA: hypothetical protein VKB09_16435 [Thermomicrobiales bacterium]|nr:hypothetical protein [Thermomicrobiales bacterium]